jgi:hypothetical protein
MLVGIAAIVGVVSRIAERRVARGAL